MNLFKVNILALLASFTLTSTSHANEIYFPDTEVYDQNKDLLAGVVKITNKDFISCTATRIAAKVLLTARHCTEKTHGSTQPVILVNGGNYNVDRILEQTPAANDKYGSSSDIALIVFKNDLGAIPIIPLASQNTKFGSNQFIAAGYGEQLSTPKSDYEKINGGLFGAAQGEWFLFKDGQGNLMEDKSLPGLSNKLKNNYPETLSSFINLECTQTDVKFKNGQTVSEGERCLLKSKLKAQVVPGDSGGPAIMFDENNTPYVVGVVSRGAASQQLADNSKYTINIVGPGKTLLDTVSFDVKLDANYENLVTPTQEDFAKETGKLNQSIKTAFDSGSSMIRIETVTQNLGVSIYTSTLTDANYKFLQDSLKELSNP